MYKVNFDYIPLIAVVVVSVAFIFLLATLTNAENVLNSSPINSNGFRVNATAKLATANTTAKLATANTNERNKTVVVPTTALTADNKTTISNTATPARSSDMSNFKRPTNAENVLNSSSINSNGFPVNATAKPLTTNEKKTVIVAPRDAKTTGTYGNPYPTGKIFPITIHGGKLVGILADENNASMILVLDPRNMTIELPRIAIVP